MIRLMIKALAIAVGYWLAANEKTQKMDGLI